MRDRKFDVAVIGAVGIDTNIYIQGKDIDFDVEVNFTDNVDYVGQAGGYAARGFSRLNKNTAFIGYVGDDFSGGFIREVLKSSNIDISGLSIDPKGTRRSCNFMYQDGRRKNFYDGKGNMELIPELSVCEEILKEANVAHFSIENWTRYLLPIAKKHGVKISCDIQDIVDADDVYRRDYIEYADILFFSSVNYENPDPIIKKFIGEHKEKIVICGMGKRGCAVGTINGIKRFSTVELDIPVIDTNGAGDGLAVGFLTSYLLEGHSLEDSILRGQITARYTCGQKASTDQLITTEELNLYYNSMKK